MRVAMLLPYPGVGGAETQARLLAEGLAQAGHQVGMIFREPDPQPVLLKWAQARGMYLSGPFGTGTELEKCVPEILRAWRPDWVISHGCPEFAALLTNLDPQPRLLWQVHTVSDHHQRIVAEWGAGFDRIVCVSEATRRRLVEKVPTAQDALAIRNGVPARFGEGVLPRRWDYRLPENAFVAGYLGRMHGDKGVHIVGSAVALDPGEMWGFLAGQAYDPSYDAQMAVIAGRCNRLRYVNNGVDSAAAIACCDVLCLPSLAEGGIFYSLMEAAVMGKPVIATPITDLPEFFRDRESILYLRERSIDAVGRALNEVRDMTEKQRQSLGQAAREVVLQELTAERMVAGYLEALA